VNIVDTLLEKRYLTPNSTTGGKGGPTVTVTSYEQFAQAVSGSEPKIILVSGTIRHEAKTRIGSNKSIIGKNSQARKFHNTPIVDCIVLRDSSADCQLVDLIGNGFFISKQKNIIIRNIKVSKVKAENGDAIGMQQTSHVWIDHVDVSSDQEHGKNYYDGLIDITHASDYVTISNSHIHDHYKASLLGHSEKNEEEDTGHLRVTFYNNYWTNINSRAPSLRFGTAHIFDSLFVNVNDGINVRKGAQVLVQQNSFVNSTRPLYTVDSTGGAVQNGNDFGDGKVGPLAQGRLSSVPYKYQATPVEQIKSSLPKTAGNTLTF
jgi:pectate lyase